MGSCLPNRCRSSEKPSLAVVQAQHVGGAPRPVAIPAQASGEQPASKAVAGVKKNPIQVELVCLVLLSESALIQKAGSIPG